MSLRAFPNLPQVRITGGEAVSGARYRYLKSMMEEIERFFFIGYEGIHRTQVLTQSFTVPTVAERNGDFSDLLALGSSYQIYDPFSRQAAANGRLSALPLAANII